MALLHYFSSSPRGINLPNLTEPLSFTMPSPAIEEAMEETVVLMAAIQHFTNSSFPYVRINVVATNAVLSH